MGCVPLLQLLEGGILCEAHAVSGGLGGGGGGLLALLAWLEWQGEVQREAF